MINLCIYKHYFYILFIFFEIVVRQLTKIPAWGSKACAQNLFNSYEMMPQCHYYNWKACYAVCCIQYSHVFCSYIFTFISFHYFVLIHKCLYYIFPGVVGCPFKMIWSSLLSWGLHIHNRAICTKTKTVKISISKLNASLIKSMSRAILVPENCWCSNYYAITIGFSNRPFTKVTCKANENMMVNLKKLRFQTNFFL